MGLTFASSRKRLTFPATWSEGELTLYKNQLQRAATDNWKTNCQSREYTRSEYVIKNKHPGYASQTNDKQFITQCDFDASPKRKQIPKFDHELGFHNHQSGLHISKEKYQMDSSWKINKDHSKTVTIRRRPTSLSDSARENHSRRGYEYHKFKYYNEKDTAFLRTV